MTQKNRQEQLFAGPTKFLGAATLEGAVVRAGRQLWVPAFNGKAGATAGWVVTGTDGALATLPASQTASTLIVPITGLRLGDTLTGVAVIGQVESAGNIATLALDVRKATAAAGDFADVSLDTAASGNLTADTLISSAGTPVAVAGLAEVLAEGEHLYALLTGTTAAVTDVAVAGVVITYSQA